MIDEFKETELGPLPAEWKVVQLGQLGREFFSGGTPSTKRPEFWNGDIAWTTSAYIGDSLYLDKGAKNITLDGLNNSSSKLVPHHNLLIGTRVGVGKAAINTIDIAISQDLTAMVVDKSAVDLEFLAHTIRSGQIQSIFHVCTRGTTIKGIPREDLIQIPIPLPPLPEQRRIAHVLNTIQREIAAEEQRKAALQELFKSMLHQLLTGQSRVRDTA
jgi:type I restriction enzyme S subunit